jgi:5-methylcytosine-specific restriction endonuclease McrA
VKKYSDSLRGYAFKVLERDGFKCVYCGLDGTASFDAWAAMSWDHLLPKGHPQRDEEAYIVCACNFCNGADNRYFGQLERRGLSLLDLSPAQLVEQRRAGVQRTRDAYHAFWSEKVAAKA